MIFSNEIGLSGMLKNGHSFVFLSHAMAAIQRKHDEFAGRTESERWLPYYQSFVDFRVPPTTRNLIAPFG